VTAATTAAAAEVRVNELASPLVTVVVSTRNHAQYLRTMLDGVAAQDVPAVELVLVDNASTDETAAVAKGFAATTTLPFTYVQLDADVGPAMGRNHGLRRARGDFVAFTDSDCVPGRGWLRGALAAFEDAVGVVQGRTECYESSAPMFSHFIETHRFDSSFSTSNVVYRRGALAGHRFDPTCIYWEDTDLGFRVCKAGWDVKFAPDALVYHHVVPQSVRRWVLWPTRYANWPAKAARYPEFRRTLFLAVWVRPLHACFDLALVSLLGAAATRRWRLALLAIPYVAVFARSRGLGGRAPAMKALLYVARDVVAFGALVRGSIRHRSVVL
jgi:cellulose synthase/poly-beta-1,6-N-acetylglucosamine synthase-like glycosyltransferase